ncbi:hypothetical protein EJB05_29183, partial [Eragrostis curvula]
MAAARTTAGHLIHVSFHFAPPPEVSRLRVCFLDGATKSQPDEFVVAELTMAVVDEHYAPKKKKKRKKKKPELLLLRYGETVLPVGDEVLCWVDLSHGILFSNVFGESPKLRYVLLPVKSYIGNVCVTAGGIAVKFVNIFPRCCCGGEGMTECHRSLHAYTINTWSLRMDDMTWVMDGMLDSTELWALNAYKGLPRVQLVFPFVSLDNPHVIFFAVDEHKVNGSKWIIMVDLKSKALLSTCPSTNTGYGPSNGTDVFPSRISDFLNPYPTNSSNNSSSTTENHLNIVAPTVKETRANNDEISAEASCNLSIDPAMQASKILTVFQQTICYGLAHHDILKAYNFLSHDNGRRFKALSELPISLRKEWLLMEIKAGEA